MLLPYHDDNPTRSVPVLTIALIVINVLVFLGISGLDEYERDTRYFEYGFVPVRLVQVFTGETVEVSAEYLPASYRNPKSFWERLFGVREVTLEPQPLSAVLLSMITCMFLHGGWLHLLGNMWFFWIFGNNVEDRLGSFNFLLFYFIGGILATLCHWFNDPMSPIPVVGASGAIAAIMGAYAVTWPTARVRSLLFLGFLITTVEWPAWVFLALWFLGQFAGVFTAGDGPGAVAWWAHIGGFVGGLILMPMLREQQTDDYLKEEENYLKEEEN